MQAEGGALSDPSLVTFALLSLYPLLPGRPGAELACRLQAQASRARPAATRTAAAMPTPVWGMRVTVVVVVPSEGLDGV